MAMTVGSKALTEAAGKMAEAASSFTGKKLDWLRCVMHDPLVPSWAFEVAYAIASHLNAITGRSFVSDETLSDETGISQRTVRRARNQLRGARWIDWKRTKTANTYEPRFDKMNRMIDAIQIKRDERNERRERRTEWPKLADHKQQDRPKLARQDRPDLATPDRPKLADIHLSGNTLVGTPYRLSATKERIIRRAKQAR